MISIYYPSNDSGIIEHELKLKRSTVNSEVIYLAMGIDHEGHRQNPCILHWRPGEAYGWKNMLKDLYRRGAEEVHLGVLDKIHGLEDAFREVYPFKH